ncbi:hypothetical protein BJ508DRAFT_327868 [Ascobolus immersus RN42]|uniref:Uncharacterized protein n=1 Tax=Ascobolus immersus RN42 TaxID=1160509 RepID=A0A3N4I160_ASCIM|nr:hypothetical protein BJ508DRAFT_327868 [Ascobolus immersus RN42]
MACLSTKTIIFLLLSASLVSKCVHCSVYPHPRLRFNTRDTRDTQDSPPFTNVTTNCLASEPGLDNPEYMLTPEGHHHLIASHQPDSIFHAYTNPSYASSVGIRRARSNQTATNFVFLLAWLPLGKLETEDWDIVVICSKYGMAKIVEKELVMMDAALERKCGSRQLGVATLGNGLVYGRVVEKGPWKALEGLVTSTRVDERICSSM